MTGSPPLPSPLPPLFQPILASAQKKLLPREEKRESNCAELPAKGVERDLLLLLLRLPLSSSITAKASAERKKPLCRHNTALRSAIRPPCETSSAPALRRSKTFSLSPFPLSFPTKGRGENIASHSSPIFLCVRFELGFFFCSFLFLFLALFECPVCLTLAVLGPRLKLSPFTTLQGPSCKCLSRRPHFMAQGLGL